jgi:DHA1 family tetracycline resistance protein-like MFS transporter
MRSRKAGIVFILITVLLDMLGIGLIVPVLPMLVTHMRGGDESAGAEIYGVFVSTYALMQFVFAPILGNLSDRYGRRPIILVSVLGSGLDYILMALAPDLAWLFAGRIIAGITGANITAANAYIADVSPPEQRGRNFGLVGACFGAGFIVGPAAGGVLAELGLRAPFIAAAILTLCNFLYGFLVLPESLPHEHRRAMEWRNANALATLRVLGRYPFVLGLAITLVLMSLAHQAFPSTWVLYTTYRFHWTELDNGLSLAVVGLMSIIVQGGLTGAFIGKFGERRTLIFGLVVACVAYALYGLANHGWMMYAIIVVSSVGGAATPALQSLVSRSVAANEQGAVQGAITSLQSLTGIVGPLLATQLFAYFISERAPWLLPGAPFFMGSALVVCATGLAIRHLARSRQHAVE